jgi:phage replication initiation protein
VKLDHLILFDWLSFTAKHHTRDSLIELLGLTDVKFEEIKGRNGWTHASYYDGISIHYGGDFHEGVFCNMSGQGCRSFESFGCWDWQSLFVHLRSADTYHVTRLDVACDERLGLFDLKKMREKSLKGEFVSKLAWGKEETSFHDEAITLYFGSPQSLIRFRIYDKAKERGREEEGHWVRFEIQLRDERASAFMDKLQLHTVGALFAQVVNNYLRFVEPSETDSNKRRWETSPFWYNFVGMVGKISLYENPGQEYNLGNLERFVISQAGAAAATYIDINGIDAYLTAVTRIMLKTSNKNYQHLREEYSNGLLPALGVPKPAAVLHIRCTCCGSVLPDDSFVQYDSTKKTGFCRECYRSGNSFGD